MQRTKERGWYNKITRARPIDNRDTMPLSGLINKIKKGRKEKYYGKYYVTATFELGNPLHLRIFFGHDFYNIYDENC